MPAKWSRERIEVPEELDSAQREALGEEILSFIRKRTARSLDKDGDRFPAYTKEYTQTLDFRNAGKTKAKVNLKLSGDMLAAMDVLSTRKGSVLIGFRNGTPENARADGNIRGTYGKPRPDASKARDFLGIDPADLETLMNKKATRVKLNLEVEGPPLTLRVTDGDEE